MTLLGAVGRGMVRCGAMRVAAEEATLAEFPERKGNNRPGDGRDGNHQPGILARKKPPENDCESCEADGAEGGSGCVDAGGHATTASSVVARFLFEFFLVALDQGDAGGKDGREGEKEAAGSGAESAGDQAREDRGGSAEEKPDEVLMRFRFFQS